jgi:hypothetical protein
MKCLSNVSEFLCATGKWRMCRSTKIIRPNIITLSPMGISKECYLHLKTTHTARPEAWSWNCICRCSVSNNTERLPICCTSLSTMHCCWWWAFSTFVTLNVKISQFCLWDSLQFEYLCTRSCIIFLLSIRSCTEYISEHPLWPVLDTQP